MEKIEIFKDKNEKKWMKITMSELLKNNGEKGKPLWVMIHNKIYDVTKFKHPGGRSLLINDDDDHYDDKGIEFDSVNHSKEALEELEKMLIGELSEEIVEETNKLQIEEKKEYIVELQPVHTTFTKYDETENKKEHFRAFMLTCIIIFLILLLIITF